MILAQFHSSRAKAREAIEHIEEVESLLASHRPPSVLGWIGHAYALAGRRDDALRILDELQSRAKQEPIPSAALASVCLGLGREEDSLDLLERALAEHGIELVWLRVGRRYDPLRPHPRFQALLRRMDFPD